MNQGKYEDAITDFAKAIELNKSNMEAYNNRAVCYNKLKDTAHMCIDLKSACDLGDCRDLIMPKRLANVMLRQQQK